MRKTLSCFIILLLIAALPCDGAAAEKNSAPVCNLVFSALPVPGKSYLCTFLMENSTSYSMNIKTAWGLPARSDRVSWSVSGRLTVEKNKELSLEISSFSTQENGSKKQYPEYNGLLVRGTNGADQKTVSWRAEQRQDMTQMPTSFLPNQMSPDALEPQKTPPLIPQLIHVLDQLYASIYRASLPEIFGADGPRKMGEAWTVGTGLTDRLARNRQVDLKRKPDLWSTKVLFTGAENFQGVPVFRVDYNVLSNPFPGYDCKIEACYRFHQDGSQSPVSTDLVWTEVVERVMPGSNPMIPATDLHTVRVCTIHSTLLPLK